MPKVPITTGFDNKPEGFLGEADFTDRGMKEISKWIEAGVTPNFAIGFIGTPDENGVYHETELIELSMVFTKGPEWKKP